MDGWVEGKGEEGGRGGGERRGRERGRDGEETGGRMSAPTSNGVSSTVVTRQQGRGWRGGGGGGRRDAGHEGTHEQRCTHQQAARTTLP